jgi:hypothetical protein
MAPMHGGAQVTQNRMRWSGIAGIALPTIGHHETASPSRGLRVCQASATNWGTLFILC